MAPNKKCKSANTEVIKKLQNFAEFKRGHHRNSKNNSGGKAPSNDYDNLEQKLAKCEKELQQYKEREILEATDIQLRAVESENESLKAKIHEHTTKLAEKNNQYSELLSDVYSKDDSLKTCQARIKQLENMLETVEQKLQDSESLQKCYEKTQNILDDIFKVDSDNDTIFSEHEQSTKPLKESDIVISNNKMARSRKTCYSSGDTNASSGLFPESVVRTSDTPARFQQLWNQGITVRQSQSSYANQSSQTRKDDVEAQNSARLYKCPSCPGRFANVGELYIHVTKIHGSNSANTPAKGTFDFLQKIFAQHVPQR